MGSSDSQVIIEVPFQEVNQNIQASDRAMNNLNNSALKYVEIMSEADKVNEQMSRLSTEFSKSAKGQDDLINSGGNLKGISTELAVCTDETRELALAQTQAVDCMRELGDIKGIQKVAIQMNNLVAIQNNQINMQDEMNSKTEKSVGLFEKLGNKAKEAISKNIVPFIKGTINEAMKADKEIRNIQNAFGNKEVGAGYYRAIEKDANESAFNRDELMNNTTNFMGMTKNTNQLDKISNLSQRLTLKNPNEGLESSGSAIKEAMQGDGKQLKDSFGFKDVDIAILSASSSMDDFIGKFDQLLNNKGSTQELLEELNNSPTAQFENIKSNFTTALGKMGGSALEALTPLMAKVNEAFSGGEFQPFFDGIATGIYIAANAVVWLVDGIMWIGQAIQDNWNVVGPILAFVAGALLGALIASLWGTMVPLIAMNWPIMLIIGAVFALIFILMQCGATIEQVCGAIGGAFGILFAFIYNQVAFVWNIFSALAEFFLNVFNHPLYAIQSLFATIWNSIVDFVGGALEGIVGMIKKIPLLRNLVGDFSKDALKIQMPEVPTDYIKLPKMEMKSYVSEFDKGYKKGEAFGSKLKDINLPDMKGLDLNAWNKDQGPGDWENQMKGAQGPGGANGIDNLSKSAQGSQNHLNNIDNNVEASTEHLDVLRDLAEIESIQNFVTLTPTVQVTTGDIKEEADINTIISKIENYMQTQLVTSAEGVYA